jgi:hypothetical protein
MYFDGSLKLEGAGAWVLLIFLKGEQLKYVLRSSKRCQTTKPSTKLCYMGSASQYLWASSDY